MNATFRTFVVGVLVFQWEWPQSPAEIDGRVGRLWMSRMIAVGIEGDIIETNDLTRALVGVLMLDPEGTLCRCTAVERFTTTIQAQGAPIGLLLETVAPVVRAKLKDTES